MEKVKADDLRAAAESLSHAGEGDRVTATLLKRAAHTIDEMDLYKSQDSLEHDGRQILGSGYTATSILAQLTDANLKRYRAKLVELRQKPDVMDDMAAGFVDGQRSILTHLEQMGIIFIDKEK